MRMGDPSVRGNMISSSQLPSWPLSEQLCRKPFEVCGPHTNRSIESVVPPSHCCSTIGCSTLTSVSTVAEHDGAGTEAHLNHEC
mmetsp:Transcript_28119/g.71920  ORF Transcript_28119/g.71920 Transcript_28119/m.71920 type:complete len:84 (-) Transcript_28119:1360-1611(-)